MEQDLSMLNAWLMNWKSKLEQELVPMNQDNLPDYVKEFVRRLTAPGTDVSKLKYHIDSSSEPGDANNINLKIVPDDEYTFRAFTQATPNSDSNAEEV